MRRNDSGMTGHALREEVDIEQPQFSKEEKLTQPTQFTQRRDIDTTLKNTAITDALIRLSQQGLKVVGAHRLRDQQTEGALRAGRGEGMESIRKRESADDWLFGTSARGNAAAKIHASTNVTNWMSDKVAKLPDDQQMTPDQYQEALVEEISTNAEAFEDPEVQKNYLTEANHRLKQLTAMQMEDYNNFKQWEGHGAYIQKIRAQASLVHQMKATGGVAYQEAMEDMKTLFTTPQEGMTSKAQQVGQATAIMTEATEGKSRHLYDIAKEMGVLDNFNEEQRAALEASYDKYAATNNPEVIQAEVTLLRQLDDDTVSIDEFETNVMAHYEYWDLHDQASDQQIAALIARKKKKVTLAKTKEDKTVQGRDFIERGMGSAFEELSSPAQQASFRTYAVLAVMNSADSDTQAGLQALEGDAPRQAQAVADWLTQPNEQGVYSPQQKYVINQLMNKFGKMPVKSNLIDSIFNAPTKILMPGGNVNPQAAASLMYQREVLNSSNAHVLESMLTRDQIGELQAFDTAYKATNDVHAAVQDLELRRKNPDKEGKRTDESTAFNLSTAAAEKAMHQIEISNVGAWEFSNWDTYQIAQRLKNLGSDGAGKTLRNKEEIRSMVNDYANYYLDTGKYEPDEAYDMAAKAVINNGFEMVHDTFVPMNPEPGTAVIPLNLAERAGFNPEFNATEENESTFEASLWKVAQIKLDSDLKEGTVTAGMVFRGDKHGKIDKTQISVIVNPNARLVTFVNNAPDATSVNSSLSLNFDQLARVTYPGFKLPTLAITPDGRGRVGTYPHHDVNDPRQYPQYGSWLTDILDGTREEGGAE